MIKPYTKNATNWYPKCLSRLKDYYHQISQKVEGIVVSYKPDHGGAFKAIHASRPYTVAPLHKETAYGLIGKGEKKGCVVVATRVPINSLESIKHMEEVADTVIKQQLKKLLEGVKEKSTEWKTILLSYAQKTGTRRVRIHFEKTRKNSIVGIHQPLDRGPADTRGQPYKYYAMGGNYCAEIFCPSKGKQAGQWQCEIIPHYYAHQKDFIPQWRKDNPTAKLVMRLQIDDMVACKEEGKVIITRVKKMTSGMIYLRSHTIAKEVADKLSWAASAKQMQLKNARKISVDIIGRIGHPKAPHQKGSVAT